MSQVQTSIHSAADPITSASAVRAGFLSQALAKTEKASPYIRKGFQVYEHCPALFFVAAAIEASMAAEIFANLQSGRLTYAANLTVPQQVADLAAWLVEL